MRKYYTNSFIQIYKKNGKISVNKNGGTQIQKTKSQQHKNKSKLMSVKRNVCIRTLVNWKYWISNIHGRKTPDKSIQTIKNLIL